MITYPNNAMGDDERRALPVNVQKLIAEAEDACQNGATLFDFGSARGTLAALQRLDLIDRSTLDRAYKRCYYLLSAEAKEAIAKLPIEAQSNLELGFIVPAAPATRDRRIQ